MKVDPPLRVGSLFCSHRGEEGEEGEEAGEGVLTHSVKQRPVPFRASKIIVFIPITA